MSSFPEGPAGTVYVPGVPALVEEDMGFRRLPPPCPDRQLYVYSWTDSAFFDVSQGLHDFLLVDESSGYGSRNSWLVVFVSSLER